MLRNNRKDGVGQKEAYNAIQQSGIYSIKETEVKNQISAT